MTAAAAAVVFFAFFNMSQSTNQILLVEPAFCYSNPQTIADNSFQKILAGLSPAEITAKCIAEFQNFRALLQDAGLELCVYGPSSDQETPDAIYPNNWLSTHAESVLCIYPMMALNRRKERRADILSDLKKRYQKFIDLSVYESQGKYLEGTGSLVLDRINKLVYASYSARTNRELVVDWANRLHYKAVNFSSFDQTGRQIYHTNVMMSIGSGYAVVCLEAIRDLNERNLVRSSLEKTGHKVIPITFAQMGRFAGNVLEVDGKHGKALVMSSAAFGSLDDAAILELRKFATPIYSELSTIEAVGGGGARCMVAELF